MTAQQQIKKMIDAIDNKRIVMETRPFMQEQNILLARYADHLMNLRPTSKMEANQIQDDLDCLAREIAVRN